MSKCSLRWNVTRIVNYESYFLKLISSSEKLCESFKDSEETHSTWMFPKEKTLLTIYFTCIHMRILTLKFKKRIVSTGIISNDRERRELAPGGYLVPRKETQLTIYFTYIHMRIF